MKTAFITDSGCGLSIAEAKQLGIFSLPLQIIDENNTYNDLENIQPENVWELLKEKKVLKSSLPTPGLIDALFAELKQQGYEQVFCICITKGLSSTADTFELMAKQHDLSFIFIDCFTTAFIQQYCITTAKKMYNLNYPMEKIISQLHEIIRKSNTILIPRNCDQLIRSGRLTGIAAALAGLLKITPWLHLNISTNGKIDALGKARSQQKLVNDTIQKIKLACEDGVYYCHITHVNDIEYAQTIANNIQSKNILCNVKKLIATVALHVGLGCIAIQYFPKVEIENESN